MFASNSVILVKNPGIVGNLNVNFNLAPLNI